MVKYVKKGTFRKRRAAAKRQMAKKATRNPGGQVVARSLGLGFPKRITMKHRYCDRKDFNVSTGSLATYNFVANGMFDPDVALGGHQPYYFDQMAALYNHYTVIASKITVTFSNVYDSSATAGAGDNVNIVGCYNNDNSTVTPTLVTELQELGGPGSYKIINADSTPIKITRTFSAKKVFGGSVLANDLLRGNSTANPLETQVYTFYLYNSNGVTTTYAFANVDIEYIAVWTELKDIAGS